MAGDAAVVPVERALAAHPRAAVALEVDETRQKSVFKCGNRRVYRSGRRRLGWGLRCGLGCGHDLWSGCDAGRNDDRQEKSERVFHGRYRVYGLAGGWVARAGYHCG